MKIGIIGGTFDPIHLGHLLIAEQAKEFARLDEVWFIPTGIPPHKQGKNITPSNHRIAMVHLATEDNSAFQVLDWEVKREKLSYTVDTVSWLTSTYPTYQFYFIVGTDMVNDLPRWHRIEQIVQQVSIIALNRPGFKPDVLPDYIQSRVHWVEDAVEIAISATHLRTHITNGNSYRYAVPDAVRQYIKEYRLYES